MFAGLILINSVKGVTITSVSLESLPAIKNWNVLRAPIQTLPCFRNLPAFLSESADNVHDDYSCANYVCSYFK